MSPTVVRNLLLSLLVTLSFGCASSSQEKAEPAAKTTQSADQASQNEPAVQDDAANANEASTKDRLVGTWQGPLKVPGAELTIVFHLDKADAPTAAGAEWTATMDSPDQGATGIPVATVSLDQDKVRLEVPQIAGVYEGTLADDEARIAGKWTQGGASLPLDLERVDADQAKGVSRPQMPEPPYPYAVEEVEFKGGEPTAGTEDAVTLAGSLTLPKADGPHPAVILVTGSGPQDRDETIMGHKPFLVLADHLTSNGIAVLRYDDRGVGKSTGAFKDATIADFTADAVGAVDFLAARSDIDADAIGIAGHSEGANVAPRASLESDKVDFLVLLAPMAVPGIELLARQNALIFEGMGMSTKGAEAYEKRMSQALVQLLEAPLDKPVSEELRKQLRADFEAALEEMSPEDRAVYGPTDPAVMEKVLDSLVDQLTSAWMRSFLAMKPVETFEQVDVPVLAVFGTKDLQVPPDQNADALRQALTKNPDATVEVLDGLNHLFQPAESGLPAEYSTISTTMAPELLEIIVTWLSKREHSE